MKNLVDNVSTTGPCKKIKQNTRVEFINLTFQLQSSDKEKLNTTFFREMNMWKALLKCSKTLTNSFKRYDYSRAVTVGTMIYSTSSR